MPNTPRSLHLCRRACATLGAALTIMAGSVARADDVTADAAATWRTLSRLGYGPTPALIEQVRQAGGARAWALREIDVALAASQKPIQLAGVPGDFNAPLPEIIDRYREEREQRRELREAKGDAALTATMGDAPPRYSNEVVRHAAAWRLASCRRG